MFPLLKKTSNKAAASSMPAWHPNFRKAELLPDTKAVRTAFFINGVAILVVIGLALYLLRSEIGLKNLNDQATDWQHQINIEKAGSDHAVIQFKKFQDEEKKLLELKEFQSAKVVGSELLMQLGESLPPRVALTTIDYHGANIILRGTISGSPDEASGDASGYLDILNKYPYFSGKFESISLTGISRNVTTDGISFEILLKLKSESKGGKK